MLGLRLFARAFSSCGKQGPLLIAVHGPLTIAASPVAEHRLQTRRLSNCDSRAQLLRGMWVPPRPGLEPVSPALAGRFSTTAPPGKPRFSFCKEWPFHSRIQKYWLYRATSSLSEGLQSIAPVRWTLHIIQNHRHFWNFSSQSIKFHLGHHVSQPAYFHFVIKKEDGNNSICLYVTLYFTKEF